MNHFSLTGLSAFLFEAKAKTYAGDGKPVESTRPNSTDYHHEQGAWAYHDCYWGGGPFIGHEIVWFDKKPVWGMNYFGGPVVDSEEINRANTFLKKALLSLNPSDIPLRGPNTLKDEFHTYMNTINGDLKSFNGHEEIALHNGKVLCRHAYHGGLIF